MDIVVKSVLDYIQSLEGHKNTILAGGAPRDMLLGLEPDDYDLCIPSSNNRDIHRLAQSINHEFNVLGMVCKTTEYEDRRLLKRKKSHTSKLTCVYGFTIEGKKIDLIGHKKEDTEEFPEEVIKEFDFGINMVYDNGSYVCDDNQDFRNDLEYRQMTLINLPYISELPKFMKRYEKLNTRYKTQFGSELRFDAKYLEISRPNENKKLGDYNIYNQSYIIEDTLASFPTEWTSTGTLQGPVPQFVEEVESDEPSF
ncbi:putative nucleotidyltransferase protein [Rhizobium phage RHph_N3_19]|nr:putative nucleotidyltransferase protein [Rhizobium phage RHph_N3_19]